MHGLLISSPDKDACVEQISNIYGKVWRHYEEPRKCGWADKISIRQGLGECCCTNPSCLLHGSQEDKNGPTMGLGVWNSQAAEAQLG